MGRRDEALADYNRVIELDPGNAWAIASRNETYQLMGRHDETHADYDTPGPGETQPYGARSGTHPVLRQLDETNWQIERYDEALADYTHSAEPGPSYRPTQDRGLPTRRRRGSHRRETKMR